MMPAAIVARQINRESCLIALIDFSRIYTKRTRGTNPLDSRRGLGKSAWYNELTRTLTPRFTQFECHVVDVDDKMQCAPPTGRPSIFVFRPGQTCNELSARWMVPVSVSVGRGVLPAHLHTYTPSPKPPTSGNKTCQSQKGRKPKKCIRSEACPSTWFLFIKLFQQPAQLSPLSSGFVVWRVVRGLNIYCMHNFYILFFLARQALLISAYPNKGVNVGAGKIKVYIFGVITLTGCSLTNHCKCEAGCDLPDVQFKYKYSPIWYWYCCPLMCGPSRGRTEMGRGIKYTSIMDTRFA